MKALLIDDEPPVIAVSRLLVDWKKHGITQVLDAGTAAQALTVIQKEQPDIILSDINLPDLNGLDLIEMLRREGNPAQVILVTAYSDFSFAQRAVKLGCVDYLLKPLSEKAINDAVEKAVQFARKEKMAQEEGKEGDDRIPGERVQGLSTEEICIAVKKHLENHFSEEVSLDILSEKYGISSSHLSRTFKKQIGLGLVDYQARLRVEKAKELLRKGEKMVTISTRVGYTDPKYFSRVFKKIQGCSPMEYKEKHI